MAVKLVTQTWREEKAEERRDFEAGKITEDELCMEQLFPDQFIADTEPVLIEFADTIAELDALDFGRISDSIKSLVENSTQ